MDCTEDSRNWRRRNCTIYSLSGLANVTTGTTRKSYSHSVTQLDIIILMKLRRSKMSGGSEKQFVDALRVYEVQHEKLDHVYPRE